MSPHDEQIVITPGPSARQVGPHGIHVDIHGAATPRHDEVLVLVHGATCGSWYWELAMPVFAEAGWDCVALNWRGHHLSPSLPDDEFVKLSLYDYVDDVEAVASRLGRPIVIVGHSIGGPVALKYAEIGSVQPRAVVLMTPAPTAGAGVYDWASPSPARAIPPFTADEARTYFFFDIEPAALERYSGLLGKESPLAVRDGGRALLDVAPHRVSGPMLVMAAQHDMMHGANSTIDHDVARHFGADYEVLRGVGHLPLVERRWREVADTMLRWLRRQFP